MKGNYTNVKSHRGQLITDSLMEYVLPRKSLRIS